MSYIQINYKGKIVACMKCYKIYINKEGKGSCKYCDNPTLGFWERRDDAEYYIRNVMPKRVFKVMFLLRKPKKYLIRRKK